MIMAMCPKLGTRGRGVSVGKGVAEAGGGRVAVEGASVNVEATVGTGDATLGGAEVMQAVIKMNNKIQKQKRFIQAFLENTSMLPAPSPAQDLPVNRCRGTSTTL